MKNAVQGLRKQYSDDVLGLQRRREEEAEKQRASERAMAEAEKFKTRKPGGEPAERQRRSQVRLEEEIRRQTAASGRPISEVERELQIDMKGRPYKVEFEHMPGAPFYRFDQPAGVFPKSGAEAPAQKVLYINTAHRFYTDLYAAPDATLQVRSALEVLLFVMGDSELDASDDRRRWYEVEHWEWSRGPNLAFDLLRQFNNIEEQILDAETDQPGVA